MLGPHHQRRRGRLPAAHSPHNPAKSWIFSFEEGAPGKCPVKRITSLISSLILC